MTNPKATRQPRRTPKEPGVTPPFKGHPAGKLGVIIKHLERKPGATADELAASLNWQKHSVRAALSRLRAGGLPLSLETRGSRKAYRLVRPKG